MMKLSWAISQVKWLSSEKTKTRTDMVFEMLVFSPLNHLTWLIAQENFISFDMHIDLICVGLLKYGL
jgi:hypothetical protein